MQAADVYAFGVLLWELYHGVRAWDGFNHAQVGGGSPPASGLTLQNFGPGPFDQRWVLRACAHLPPACPEHCAALCSIGHWWDSARSYAGGAEWSGVLQVIHAVAIMNSSLEFSPGTPAHYQDLSKRCMSVDASLRPTFEEVVAELHGLEAELAGEA